MNDQTTTTGSAPSPAPCEAQSETTYDLDQMVLVRSDLGDGGWSIHVRRLDVDEADDPQGAWPIVACGPSDPDRDTDGWNRPDQSDWARARECALAMATRSIDPQ